MGHRIIIHIDMDAFFTSVEHLDFPVYRAKPTIVGADPKQGLGRGVVATASYEARRYGIHSAMPISQAYRRCPNGIFLRPRLERYRELSREIFEVLKHYSEKIEPLSIDEAFLDCTHLKHLGSTRKLGMQIKVAVKQATGLTASIGIASNRSIAKIASDLYKPNGLCICRPGHEKRIYC